ncbi:MAG: COX15/CtaA family protein [Nevskia sp.]|nr:COX15/CtaA family protein [Nevskia sp.]
MRWFRRINLLALVLCFGVVVLGAYVRLSNAGLGCPDWPGCYGHLTVTAAQHDTAAGSNFPSRPTVEAPKAWKEMIHRYFASTLGLMLLALAGLAWTDRSRRLPRGITLALVGTVCLQGALGALTVLWNVNPVTVTGHLLVGLTTLALLWWLWLRGLAPAAADAPATPRAGGAAAPPAVRALAALALLLLALQIFLGGWTSSNYAATACPDFPACQGSLLPRTPLAQAFAVWHGTGANYEFGILDGAARATIHLLHRYGALLVSLVIGTLCACLLAAGRAPLWRRLGWALLGALALQLGIGIGIVKMRFPLWLADAHNGGAALLLLTVVALNYFAWRDADAATRTEGRA